MNIQLPCTYNPYSMLQQMDFMDSGSMLLYSFEDLYGGDELDDLRVYDYNKAKFKKMSKVGGIYQTIKSFARALLISSSFTIMKKDPQVLL
jgi:hypothetical protein